MRTIKGYISKYCIKIELTVSSVQTVVESFITPDDSKNPISLVFLINNLKYMYISKRLSSLDVLVALGDKVECKDIVNQLKTNINNNIAVYYRLTYFLIRL